ncbi:YhdP family protein [Pseudomonas sp. S9]|uniref:YhdP family protein n=1 Tax=Pseudomonas sp. S9 TaxID=686578 RepID=UPI00030E93E4|nr:YhdP family protein [Pseudomonas sp. S9]
MARSGGWLARVLRWSLGLCALVLITTALLVSLGRLFTPMVAEYRIQVEDKAQAVLGLPVSIGSLEGSWHGLAPVFVAHDVTLGKGANAVRLDQIRLIPDLVASAMAMQPRAELLAIDGLQLSVVQSDSGQWQVEGLPRPQDDTAIDVEKLLAQLKMVRHLWLLNSQVTLAAAGQPAHSLRYVNLTLGFAGGHQRLDGRLQLPDGKPMELQVRTQMDVKKWRDLQAEVYLQLPETDWASWLPQGLTQEWSLSHLQLGGQFWLSWADRALQRAVTQVKVARLEGQYAERKPASLTDMQLNSYFGRDAEGLQAQLANFSARAGEQQIGPMNLTLRQHAKRGDAAEFWTLSFDRLEVAPLLPLVESLAPIPDKGLSALATLNPRGALTNATVGFHPDAEGDKRVQFATNTDAISFSAYDHVPGIENITGSVTGDLGSGTILLDAKEFSLDLATLFPKAWLYHTARGQVDWRINEQGLTLRSPYVQATGDEGKAAADFLIRLTGDPEIEDYMDLRVGITEGDARFTEKYLPTRVPEFSPELANWLKTSIKAGAVDQGYFQFQGSLNKGSSKASHSISLYFAVHDAELAYQPGWPELKNARGEVLIEDDQVRIRVPQGQVLNSTAKNVQVSIPLERPDTPPNLLLTADLESSVVDALKILKEAPIGTSDIFAGWQGKGDLTGALDLDIPLHKGAPPKVIVDFTAKDAEVKIGNPKLDLSHVSGAFRYDTAKGLSAPSIEAQLLGHKARGKAVAQAVNGRATSLIDVSGQVPLQRLTQWLAVTQPIPANGNLPYRLRLNIDGEQTGLQIDSGLKGLAIDLPAPFGKSAEDQRNATLELGLGGDQRSYKLRYANLLSFNGVAPASDFLQGRGELRLGGGLAQLPSQKGYRLRGSVAELDLSDWQRAIEPYMNSSKGSALQAFSDAQLDIGRFVGFGKTVNNLGLGVRRSGAAWALSVDSTLAKGNVIFPDASSRPISADLAYIHLPEDKPGATAKEEGPDPLADVDPRKIPSIDLKVAEVKLGKQSLGASSLKARPAANGVQFSDLNINLAGLRVNGTAGWQGEGSGARSWYKGRFEGEKLQDVLKAWGFAPTATSEHFRLDVDGNWPGSPLNLSLARFSGAMNASLRKGQFVEVQGSASALRVFGLLNFNSIGRRLRLDFSDLLGEGLSYDRVKGDLQATNGVYVTSRPITLKGPSSDLELNGTLNMVDESIDAKLLVTLPVTNNLPIAALIVGAPAIGGALFVVDKLLGDHFARFASVQYDVKGPIQSPKIDFDKPFEKPK